MLEEQVMYLNAARNKNSLFYTNKPEIKKSYFVLKEKVNSQWINEIGKELENKYSISWLYSDFKKKDGYKQSILLSQKYNLYRQNYCGCIYSKPQ